MLIPNEALASMIAPRRRRSARRRQQALPDWVWGAGIAAVVLGFAAAFLVLSGTLSGSGGTCDSALKPLESSDISAQGFAAEDAGMGKVIEALSRGDRSGAESAFYGPVHNFTHNGEPRTREKNGEMGKQLCAAIIRMEGELTSGTDALQLSSSAQRLRELLRQSAEALGYPRPG